MTARSLKSKAVLSDDFCIVYDVKEWGHVIIRLEFRMEKVWQSTLQVKDVSP